MSTAGEVFVTTAATPWEHHGDGVRRQILGRGGDLMLVRVDFDTGAEGKLHHHPHRQATYVASGRFAVAVGGDTRELGPGDSFFALGDVVHGVLALEAGTLIDAFTPARLDFLATPG